MSCNGIGSISRIASGIAPDGDVGLLKLTLPLRCLTRGLAGGWMYCSALEDVSMAAIVDAPVPRRTGRGGGFASGSGLLAKLAEVTLRDVGGGKGRDLVWTVSVDAEETERLRLARWSGELVGGRFFRVVRPSPVLVDVRARGFVGFGGGRFCEVGVDEADDTDVPIVELAETLRSSSAWVRGWNETGVPLRGAGGGGALRLEA